VSIRKRHFDKCSIDVALNSIVVIGWKLATRASI
jgi:hypothetical protein